ncbi:MAG: hypothetical protein RL417_1239 [Pseudomonadota bacterium]|jgi:hypothetical protein
MSNRDLEPKKGVIDWSEVKDLRHISAPDMAGLERIQTEFDFAERAFLERHASRPSRAIIRAEKEAELLTAWQGDGGTLLRAPWRAGKTELVFAAIENAHLQDRFLFVNSQEAPYPALRFRTADEFRQIYGAREAINHVVELRGRLGEEISRNEVSLLLDRHIQAGGSPFSFVSTERRSHNLPPALLALDEIADYGFDREQLGYLASLTNESHIRLCLIVQKAPSIEPFYDIAFKDFNGVFLTPLTVGETAQIVRATAAENNINFSLHGIIEVHRAAGGRPLEVTALVEACAQATERGRHGVLYTRADVAKLTRGEILRLTETPVEPLLTNHIRVYERGITERERHLIDRLVERNFGVTIDPELKPEVDNLLRYGLVSQSHNRVFLNGELFREAISKRMEEYRILNYWQPDEYGNDYI